ncbi:hypothetical protein TIFTF001_025803, partial [Ficus carica]
MKTSVRPPGSNAGDLNTVDKPPFSENTGTRVLGPDCAPSTLSQGMYPRLVGVPRAHTPLRADWMLVTRLRPTRC